MALSKNFDLWSIEEENNKDDILFHVKYEDRELFLYLYVSKKKMRQREREREREQKSSIIRQLKTIVTS